MAAKRTAEVWQQPLAYNHNAATATETRQQQRQRQWHQSIVIIHGYHIFFNRVLFCAVCMLVWESVEVEQGNDWPYKNTNLQWEVLSMRLPPTQAGRQVLGNTIIDGAHMVLAGPTRRQLHLLY
jgi:hypothetical protein